MHAFKRTAKRNECQYSFCTSYIFTKFCISLQIFIEFSNIKFDMICPVGTQMIYSDRCMDDGHFSQLMQTCLKCLGLLSVLILRQKGWKGQQQLLTAILNIPFHQTQQSRCLPSLSPDDRNRPSSQINVLFLEY